MSRLHSIADRLKAIAAELGGEVDDVRAAALAEEAAELAAEAVEETNRAVRESED